MLFLGPSIVHWMCYLMYFFAKSMALFKLKKGNWVHLGWVKCNGVNSCY